MIQQMRDKGLQIIESKSLLISLPVPRKINEKKRFVLKKKTRVYYLTIHYTCTYVSYQAFHPLKLDHNASNKTFVVRIFTLSSCFSITGKMFVQFSKPAFGSLLQFPKHFLCQLTRSSASKIPPMVFMARNVKSV